MKNPPKTRLDAFLVRLGRARDLKEAEALILAGRVRLKGRTASPGTPVKDARDLEFLPAPRFVSRGGDKLQGALNAFGVRAAGKRCLDVGASTGGFTDCLLQGSARSVTAVDVGGGLLDPRLRNDPRVRVLERTNVRHVPPAVLGDPFDLAVVDVSFISLKHVLPVLSRSLRPGAEAIVLVKPQFEGEPREVPRGIVKDEPTRRAILDRTRAAVAGTGFRIAAEADSAVRGRRGNQETFFYLIKQA